MATSIEPSAWWSGRRPQRRTDADAGGRGHRDRPPLIRLVVETGAQLRAAQLDELRLTDDDTDLLIDLREATSLDEESWRLVRRLVSCRTCAGRRVDIAVAGPIGDQAVAAGLGPFLDRAA